MTYNSDASSLDLVSLSVLDLIRLHRRTLYELKERGIVRTLNHPQGDWAERLVKDAYGGVLASTSEKGYDVLANGERLQVKSRAIDHRNMRAGELTSTFRSWEFDRMVVVLLNPTDLSVGSAAELTRQVVWENKIERSHVNGFVLTPNDALMSQGKDVTEALHEAALRL